MPDARMRMSPGCEGKQPQGARGPGRVPSMKECSRAPRAVLLSLLGLLLVSGSPDHWGEAPLPGAGGGAASGESPIWSRV